MYVVRETTFIMVGGRGEGNRKFTAVKVPWQCPVFRLVVVGWNRLEHLGVKKALYREFDWMSIQ